MGTTELGKKLEAYEKALRSLWNDRCSIVIRDERTDPTTRITGFDETVLHDNVPCKLSFKLPFGKTNLTGRGTFRNAHPAAEITHLVKIFLAPELEVPPGCKISVRHRGRVEEYAQSGKASVYTYHQEISLTLFEKWA